MLLHCMYYVLLLSFLVGDYTVERLYKCHTTLRRIVHHLQPSQHLLSFNVGLIIFPCKRIVDEEVTGDVKSSEQSSGVLIHKVTELFHLYVCCSGRLWPRSQKVATHPKFFSSRSVVCCSTNMLISPATSAALPSC